MPERIAWVAIPVSDIDRAVNFYAGVFDDSEGNRLALHSEA